MSFNGYRSESKSELSPYQKRIEAIDNVILCVAEAEKMVGDIGRSLYPALAIEKKPRRNRTSRRIVAWSARRTPAPTLKR